MAITFRYDAGPIGARAAYAVGQGRARQRRRKYLMDMAQRQQAMQFQARRDERRFQEARDLRETEREFMLKRDERRFDEARGMAGLRNEFDIDAEFRDEIRKGTRVWDEQSKAEYDKLGAELADLDKMGRDAPEARARIEARRRELLRGTQLSETPTIDDLGQRQWGDKWEGDGLNEIPWVINDAGQLELPKYLKPEDLPDHKRIAMGMRPLDDTPEAREKNQVAMEKRRDAVEKARDALIDAEQELAEELAATEPSPAKIKALKKKIVLRKEQSMRARMMLKDAREQQAGIAGQQQVGVVGQQPAAAKPVHRIQGRGGNEITLAIPIGGAAKSINLVQVEGESDEAFADRWRRYGYEVTVGEEERLQEAPPQDMQQRFQDVIRSRQEELRPQEWETFHDIVGRPEQPLPSDLTLPATGQLAGMTMRGGTAPNLSDLEVEPGTQPRPAAQPPPRRQPKTAAERKQAIRDDIPMEFKRAHSREADILRRLAGTPQEKLSDNQIAAVQQALAVLREFQWQQRRRGTPAVIDPSEPTTFDMMMR